MKKLGLATIAAAGLMAAVLGFAGPANADSDTITGSMTSSPP